MEVRRKQSERGGAMVEAALLAPWIFFLFVGVFDLGFYTYGAICTQNAARAAAVQTASSVGAYYQSDALACTAVLNELSLMPNVVGVSSCSALPVQMTRKTLCSDTSKVTYVSCDGTDSSPLSTVYSQTEPAGWAGWPASSQVSVTYQSSQFIPIPGILTGKLTITRIAEARIINE